MTDSPTTAERNAFQDLSPAHFRIAIGALALLFLVLEIVYITRFPVIMDEFVDAEIVHKLRTQLPYRDLPTGKTVLGYYTQLPVLALVHDKWNALLAVKVEMAILAAASIAFAALAMAKQHSRTAVALAVALLFAMSTFNERAAEFRSDMPTAICGLIALLLLLERRYAAAGLTCAISLMMSQKAAYHVIASDVALAISFLAVRKRARFTGAIVFNAVAAVTFAAYLVFFSLLAGFRTVMNQTFTGASAIAFKTFYADLRAEFWTQTINRNPVFYALAAAAIIDLVIHWRRDAGRAGMLGAYALTVTALCAWHKQPWPYFFVILLPTLFVAQIPFIETLLRHARRATIAGLIVFAVALPVAIRLPATLARDSSFQRCTFRIGDAMLDQGGTYLAGAPIFYDRSQAGGIPLNTLDGYWQQYLRQLPKPEMMRLIAQLDAAPIRLIVLNYRLRQTAPLLQAYLQSRYAHYWGGIFVYAPIVLPGQFTVKFDGTFVAQSRDGQPFAIDGKQMASGSLVPLHAGSHNVEATDAVRLRLEPAIDRRLLDPNCRDVREFFPNVYQF